MIKTKRACIICAIAQWIAFYLLDSSFQSVVSEAVRRKEGLYGEMYGPLSYFRSLCLYAALVVTMVGFAFSWKDSAALISISIWIGP